jgi:hypothetical protein
VSPPRNAAVRRFALVWTASTLWKLLALATFLVLAVKLSGGGGL